MVNVMVPSPSTAVPCPKSNYKSLLLLMTVFMAVCTGTGCSDPSPPLSNKVEAMVKSHIDALILSDFPELMGIAIEYAPVTNEADTIFFETYVKTSTVLRRPKYRTYQIFANERLLVDHPDDGAIRAILVHELLHIRDYMNKSIWELWQLKQDYKEKDFQQQYERSIDQRTLEMGYGAGLARYRKWIYQVIADPEQVAFKRQIYMTPEEITSWIERRQH